MPAIAVSRERRAAAWRWRAGAVARRDDDLGQHRIVERRDLGAGLDPGVDAGVMRERHLGQQAGAGPEIGVRDLGIEPHLDRRAVRAPAASRGIGVLAGRLADHPFDEVDAEHRFGDRMLDLEARVDLEEVELLASRIVDELDRAGRVVVDGAAEVDGGLVQRARGRRRTRPGAGVSSTTFWLRRCSEQSRSPSATTLPLPSPKICTSTWRASATKRSR